MTTHVDIGGLAEFLVEKLYKPWAQNRQKLLESKWTKNKNAFECVSDGFWKTGEGEDWRSNDFYPLTRMKVLAAYSMIIDMQLQDGDLPIAIEQAPEDAALADDLDDETRAGIDESIEDANGLIKQQMSDCKADAEQCKLVLSTGEYGEGCYEKYVHSVAKPQWREINLAEGLLQEKDPKYIRWEKIEIERDQPGWQFVSCWDIFRDLETDDMQHSEGYFHREFVSPYELRQEKGNDNWIDKAIDRVISEAAAEGDREKISGGEIKLPPRLRGITSRRRNIQVLRFYGRSPRALVEEFKRDMELEDTVVADQVTPEVQSSGDDVEVVTYLANERIVFFAEVPEGDRPHGRVEWETRIDSPGAQGVADNAEAVQTTLNGMIRAFLDNKKLSANVIFAIQERMLPDWEKKFTPGENIPVSEVVDDVRKALQQVVVQDVGESLLSGIGLYERYGDEAVLLPKILQGAQHEKQKADTATELSMLQQNAGKYLASVLRNFDRQQLEPLGTWFFDWNMEDPHNTTGKGNYRARAKGYKIFQDRVARLQKIMQLIGLIAGSQPLLAEANLRPGLKAVVRASDEDPDDWLLSQEQKAERMQQQMEMQAKAQQQDAAAAAEAEAASERQKEADHRRAKEMKREEFKNKVAERALGTQGAAA